MSDEPAQIPTDAPAPFAEARVDAPPPVSSTETVDAHPEYVVAGAFAGAFLFAKILRRIGGGS